MDPATFGVTPDLTRAAIDGTELKLLLSGVALLVASVVRLALMRLIRRGEGVVSDRQRWWLSLVKNLTVVAAIVLLARIWADELQNAALSLAAVAVAFVVATKELILCVSGATWRGLTQPFSVGDWIEIGPYSGEVIDESLLSTELQEVDPRDYALTGRTISVPNSLLLTTPLVNNHFRKRYITLSFDIHEEGFEPNRAGALRTRDRIAAAVEAFIAEHGEVARRFAARIEKSAGARIRDPEPAVTLHTTDLAKLCYRVTAFCPRDRASALKDAAMRAFLSPG